LSWVVIVAVARGDDTVAVGIVHDVSECGVVVVTVDFRRSTIAIFVDNPREGVFRL
jgi:hypothetical protein